MATQKHSYIGARQVTSTEAEINKNNRLSTMMEIHAKRQQGREQMPDQKTTKCEICGGKKKTNMNHGKNVCSSCVALQAKAKNSPKIVMEVMQFFHGDKYFQPATAPPVNDKPEGYFDAIDRAYDIEHEQVVMLFQALKKSNENNNDLKDAYDTIHELADQKTKEIERLVSMQVSDQTESVKEPYETHDDLQPATAITINTFDSLHDLLWLLKGMVITGNVNGPGQQHIDALEEVVGKSPIWEEVV